MYSPPSYLSRHTLKIESSLFSPPCIRRHIISRHEQRRFPVIPVEHRYEGSQRHRVQLLVDDDLLFAGYHQKIQNTGYTITGTDFLVLPFLSQCDQNPDQNLQ